MPNQLLPKRWASQPQYPTGIDWGNPITRGLVWAFNGAMPRVPALGITGFTDSGTVSEVIGINGRAVSSTGKRAFSSSQCNSGTFTVFCAFEDSGTRGVARSPFDSDNNATTPQRVWQMYLDASNFPGFIGFSTGGGPFIPTGATANSAAGVTTLAGVVELTSVRVYMNGLLAANQTKGSSSMNVPLATNLVGIAGGLQGNPFGGRVLQAAIFDRVLADPEIAALSSNPWQIFAPSLS